MEDLLPQQNSFQESTILQRDLPQPWNQNDVECHDINFEDNTQHEQWIDIEDQIPSQEECIIVSSGSTTRSLTVSKVIACETLPEFPSTSTTGVAYLVDTSGLTEEQSLLAAQNVQYCRKRAMPDKPSYSAFLDAQCIKTTFTCTGIKYCQYLDEQLLDMHHTQIRNADLQKIIDLRRLRSGSTRKNQANSLFISVTAQFLAKKACGLQTDATCKPVFRRSNHQNVAGNYICSIACVNKESNNRHYLKPITTWLQNELSFLEERFKDNFVPEEESCYVTEQTMARKVDCGVDHPQGRGILRSFHNCNVVFRLFLPESRNISTHFLWTSHGEHSHPPPTPSRAPAVLIAGLISVIQRINDPSLTTGTLLRNPMMRSFYEQYHGTSLGEIHKSMVNMDRISVVLRKQQLLLYPEGQSIAGLQYEYNSRHRHAPNPYIQYFHSDAANLMVICFFNEAARVFLTLESFEVDMTFKRVKDSQINEVVFAAFLPQLNKVMTFIRVYVNRDSTEMYLELFTQVFRLLSVLGNKEVNWQHLHGSGFGSMVMDMDSKQLSGFGKYLRSIDPHQRDWQWQVKHTIIFCTIHFKRGIIKATGTADGALGQQSRMGQLLEVASKEEYMELCGLFIASEISTIAIKKWAQHKRIEIIASGLNRHCSAMDNELFERTRRHTNAVEQTHFKSASLGRKLSLLKAVKMGEIIDRRDVDQYNAKVNHGVDHSWRTKALSARFSQAEARDRSRKRQRDSTHGDDFEALLSQNDELEVLSNASSSGYSRGSRRGSRSPRKVMAARRVPLRQTIAYSQPPPSQEMSQKDAIELQMAKAQAHALELQNEKTELELIKLRQELGSNC